MFFPRAVGGSGRRSTLRDRGAKMAVYHGTSDPIFCSDDTQNCYDGLTSANGGSAATPTGVVRQIFDPAAVSSEAPNRIRGCGCAHCPNLDKSPR